ncbi:MAG: uncharacterized membrane protein YraQ (UPF0718 family) [Desulforhopalus sp.]|jgi:uncharacterized membrane protein YraQ (UPF0718 family)
MTFLIALMDEVWEILLDSSFYILLGIAIAGLLKVTLNPNTILEHLGKGRFLSVIKASFFGVPLPL